MEEEWEEIPNCIEFMEEFLLILSLKAFLLMYTRLVIPNLFRDLIKFRSRQLMATLLVRCGNKFSITKSLALSEVFFIQHISLCWFCVKLLTTEGSEDTELNGNLNGNFAGEMLKQVQHDKKKQGIHKKYLANFFYRLI